MCLVKSLAPAVPCHADVTADGQALEEREVKEEAEEVINSQRMADPRRPKRSLMLRWRIIGAQRRMEMALQPKLLRTILT